MPARQAGELVVVVVVVAVSNVVVVAALFFQRLVANIGTTIAM